MISNFSSNEYYVSSLCHSPYTFCYLVEIQIHNSEQMFTAYSLHTLLKVHKLFGMQAFFVTFPLCCRLPKICPVLQSPPGLPPRQDVLCPLQIIPSENHFH